MLSFLLVFNTQNKRLRFSRIWNSAGLPDGADKQAEFFKLIVRKVGQSVCLSFADFYTHSLLNFQSRLCNFAVMSNAIWLAEDRMH